MMIRESIGHGLSEPGFELRPGEFVTTVWRDWLTTETAGTLGLNERQLKAVSYVRSSGHITNREYRKITGATERTALRDLAELLDKRVLDKRGETGRSAHYIFAAKPDRNPPSQSDGSNPPQTRQTRRVPASAKRAGTPKPSRKKGPANRKKSGGARRRK